VLTNKIRVEVRKRVGESRVGEDGMPLHHLALLLGGSEELVPFLLTISTVVFNLETKSATGADPLDAIVQSRLAELQVNLLTNATDRTCNRPLKQRRRS